MVLNLSFFFFVVMLVFDNALNHTDCRNSVS